MDALSGSTDEEKDKYSGEDKETFQGGDALSKSADVDFSSS